MKILAAVNKISVAILKSGLPIPPLTRNTALLIETKGRRTGKTCMTPAGYSLVDARHVKIVSERGEHSDWFRNANANGDVHVWIGGQRHRAKVQLLDNEDPIQAWQQQRSVLVVMAAKATARGPKVVGVELL